ncbi:hypothetical protein [Actinomadura gamaensis]|uniref:PH domain-containing protein n=1 Tax=Actinomadura gamaensis TaxID=1763541 RepID=A0ABV9U5R0_9ACTN
MKMKPVRRVLYCWGPVTFGSGLWLGCWFGLLVEGSTPGAWALVLVVTASLTAIWSVGWGNAVRYNDTHVSVTNVLITRRVAWQDVVRVRVGKGEGLVIWIRDGRELHSIQYGKSLLGDICGYRTFQRPREILDAAHKKALSQHLGERTNPVRVETTLWWRPPLVTAVVIAASFAFALLLSPAVN